LHGPQVLKTVTISKDQMLATATEVASLDEETTKGGGCGFFGFGRSKKTPGTDRGLKLKVAQLTYDLAKQDLASTGGKEDHKTLKDKATMKCAKQDGRQ